MKTTAAILAPQPKPLVGQALAWVRNVVAPTPDEGNACSVVTGRTTTQTEASDRDIGKEIGLEAPAERLPAKTS